MRDVSQHFEIIERAIEYSPAIEAEIESERFDATNGRITGVLYFADGSRLEFSELVVIEKSRLVKSRYRYQFVRGDETVFRYDNAPHHDHVSTHPHHKHVGNEILPAIEPGLGQVLGEVSSLLLEGTNQPAKKQRSRKPRSK